MIYDGENGVVSIAFGESRDEVHRYVGERFGVNGGRDMEEQGFDVVCQVFVLLTGGASFDIFRDPRFGAWPEVFSVDVSDRFISTRVAIDGAFVPNVHQFAF